MPLVIISVTPEGLDEKKKARLIRGTTELLVDVLDKDPATTIVLITEVPTDNWGIAGETVTARRRRHR